MTMTMSPARDRRAAFLGNPSLASALARYVRTRVPTADVDDIVQSTLADALASGSPPENEAELQPWVFGIARNKIADFFRRNRREVPQDPQAHDEVANEASAESAPPSAKDLLRWAERELPEGDGAERTLEWMLREGAGEKLETIAAEENVPAPRVRQRVARLRKHFRARWAAQLAAVAALVAIALAMWAMWKRRGNDIAVPEPAPSMSTMPAPQITPKTAPELRAAQLRKGAFDACDAQSWRPCLDGLDAAAQLDPAGDSDARVQAARKRAEDALAPKPPAPAPTTPTTKKDSIDSRTQQTAPSSARPAPTAPSTMPAPTPTDMPTDAPVTGPKAPPQGPSKAGPKPPPFGSDVK
jgi:RNA polymerase sigma factor (sigma-70 family)